MVPNELSPLADYCAARARIDQLEALNAQLRVENEGLRAVLEELQRKEDHVTHNCPVKGCSSQVPAEHLMCRFHWMRVPAELRAQVWQAWKAYGLQNLTWEDYAEVRSRAIAAADAEQYADEERMREERI